MWFHLCVLPDDPQAVVCLLWVFFCPIPCRERHHCLRKAAGKNCLQMLRHSHRPHELQSEKQKERHYTIVVLIHYNNIWQNLYCSCFHYISLVYRTERSHLIQSDRVLFYCELLRFNKITSQKLSNASLLIQHLCHTFRVLLFCSRSNTYRQPSLALFDRNKCISGHNKVKKIVKLCVKSLLNKKLKVRIVKLLVCRSQNNILTRLESLSHLWKRPMRKHRIFVRLAWKSKRYRSALTKLYTKATKVMLKI